LSVAKGQLQGLVRCQWVGGFQLRMRCKCNHFLWFGQVFWAESAGKCGLCAERIRLLTPGLTAEK
jgi:hypothetical protein